MVLISKKNVSNENSISLDELRCDTKILIPRLSTVQRNALGQENGDVIYNKDTNKYEFYENGLWTEVTTGGAGTFVTLSTNQNITGQKQFTNNTHFGNVLNIPTSPIHVFTANPTVQIESQAGGTSSLLMKGQQNNIIDFGGVTDLSWSSGSQRLEVRNSASNAFIGFDFINKNCSVGEGAINLPNSILNMKDASKTKYMTLPFTNNANESSLPTSTDYYGGLVYQEDRNEIVALLAGSKVDLVHKSTTGLDASSIHDASVSNTEFGHLNGVTSSIQSQIDSKASLTGAEVLTNKTINADNNTITNIANAQIKTGAGISASKIADGTIDNDEFQALQGVIIDPGNRIQDQLNNRVTLDTAQNITGNKFFVGKPFINNNNFLQFRNDLPALDIYCITNDSTVSANYNTFISSQASGVGFKFGYYNTNVKAGGFVEKCRIEHGTSANDCVLYLNNKSMLSDTTLGASVVNSSLTSVGTLTNLAVTNNITQNGGVNVVDLSTAQTLTNKTMAFDSNTLTNVCSLNTAQTLTAIKTFPRNTKVTTSTPGDLTALILENTHYDGGGSGADLGLQFTQPNIPGNRRKSLYMDGNGTSTAPAVGSPHGSICCYDGVNTRVFCSIQGNINDNFIDLPISGSTYKIGGTTVLSNNTLGSGVINSSLENLGTLSSKLLMSSNQMIQVRSDFPALDIFGIIYQTGASNCMRYIASEATACHQFGYYQSNLKANTFIEKAVINHATTAGDATFSLNGNQVLQDRITGWGAPTGTATRTAFDTTTVTLQALAERLKALIDDCRTHGFIQN